jgi:dual specificity MAP kinase phosphatase
MAGISRSATIAIAYVMKKLSLTCPEATKFVKDRHPIAEPNIGFMYQLEYYEKQVMRV